MKVEICNKKNDKLVLDYVVIFAKYKEQWILVRHRDRNTWEFPVEKLNMVRMRYVLLKGVV